MICALLAMLLRDALHWIARGDQGCALVSKQGPGLKRDASYLIEATQSAVMLSSRPGSHRLPALRRNTQQISGMAPAAVLVMSVFADSLRSLEKELS